MNGQQNGTAENISNHAEDQCKFSYDNQSLLVPGPERIRVWHGTDMGKNLMTNVFSGMKSNTVVEAFKRGHETSQNRPAFGTIQNGTMKWMNYKEVKETAEAVQWCLHVCGVEKHSNVVIHSLNRPEWDLAHLGILMYSAVTVPLYDSLGYEGVKCAVEQTQASLVFLGDQSKAAAIVEAKTADLAPVQHAIFFEECDEETQQKLKGANVQYRTWNDFLELKNRKVPLDKEGSPELSEEEKNEVLSLPSEEDTATIIYTSGTTGTPKGVVLSHKSWIASISAAYSVLTFGDQGATIDRDMLMFSYLPSAHTLNLGLTYLTYAVGGSIGYYSRNTAKIMDDLKTIRPNVFPIVPRLLNKIYDKVQENASGDFKKKLLHLALTSKLSSIQRGNQNARFLYEYLILRKLRNLLGGRVKLMVTGSAPVSKEVLDFARAAFGCVLIEAYGQSESNAGVAATLPGDFSTGHVGPPLPTLKIKLVDVEEMNYSAANDEGEICYQGTNTMVHYYKNPQETQATVDSQGWIHSGDIGKWLPNGTLKIIDRKKNIFKLAQGEYISAEKLESLYTLSPLINNIYIHGDSLESYIVAVGELNKQAFLDLQDVKSLNIKQDEFNTELLKKEVRKIVLVELEKLARSKKCNSLEIIRNIHLTLDPFSVENDMLTPTFKLKRQVVRKHFAQEIENLFKEGQI